MMIASSRVIVRASGECSCSRAARSPAQAGTAACPRHHLFTWRGVDADEPREGGLGDAGAGQKRGELAVRQAGHAPASIELGSTLRGCRGIRDTAYAR